jgi:hypothetical protein
MPQSNAGKLDALCPPCSWPRTRILVLCSNPCSQSSATGMAPFYMLTDQLPNGSNLCIFGCQVFVQKLGDRENKLDIHSVRGIFLGYTTTDKNIHYFDCATKQLKTATHVVFDKANFTLPPADCPASSQALIDLGYTNRAPTSVSSPQHYVQPDHASVHLLSPSVQLPTRGTKHLVGYDAYSPQPYTLQIDVPQWPNP